MTRWLKFAHKISRRGIHPQHQLGAVVVKGGAVIAAEANFNRPWTFNNLCHHAEMRALSRCKDAEGASIYIVRGNWRCSKPCSNCMDYCRRSGIAKVVYINQEGIPQADRI